MGGVRNIQKPDGTPLQQGMVFNPADYNNYRMTRPMLGIVLDVHLSDDQTTNRIAQQYTDRRGPLHLASVLILDDGGPADLPHPEVVITPDSRTGIDDYSENLPKGSTCLVSGDELNDGLHNIDPNIMDGDMCVVEFIGGRLDSGFISRWWPHTSNTFDPATSGEGNPDISGEGTSLNQSGRSFTRINGVEYVVTRHGDVYLSTSLSGTKIIPGEGSQIGRFARTRIARGGNVRVNIKPTAFFEMDWNFQEDGIGVGNSHDPSLPQTNPRESTPFSVLHNGSLELAGTYLRFGAERVLLEVPEEIKLKTLGRTFIESGVETRINSAGITSIDSEGVISLETRASLFAIAQAGIVIQGLTATLAAGGGLTEDEQALAGKISAEGDSVLLGPDNVPDPVTGEPVDADTDSPKRSMVTDLVDLEANKVAVLAANVESNLVITAAGPAPTPAQTGAALEAIGITLTAINTLLQGLGITEFTKAN